MGSLLLKRRSCGYGVPERNGCPEYMRWCKLDFLILFRVNVMLLKRTLMAIVY